MLVPAHSGERQVKDLTSGFEKTRLKTFSLLCGTHLATDNWSKGSRAPIAAGQEREGRGG